jgi:serine/threonine protein kinase/DNA-binding SARP family transcriptional activator/ABC-type glycerol-3-phosphate transport system substrate-binding protein
VEYRVLGKLEVLQDGRAVDLGSFRQRALLALLLTAPNSMFSTDQIIDGLWGADGGIDKQNALWVYVSGLRKALEPNREKRSGGSILLTRAPGYVIEAAPEEIDAVRFERMVAEGRALADVDPPAASLVLGEALALWRGRAFEDFTYESFAQAEIARLEELRLEAVEARIDADLKRGMSRELISELESLVRQHPLQERLTGQLMLALYRSARQADALRAYQQLKSRLGEELGIAPSSALRKLEEQIVTGDEALEIRSVTAMPGTGAEPGLAVRGYELRDRIGEGASGVAYRAYQPAVGREVAIKVIRPEQANNPNFIRRFQAEAQLVARIEHPHIVPLYDYWREPDAAYLVMRLMRGGSLATLLEHRALSPAQTTTMVDQLGSALQTAHRSGVVHRDIKPANILIDDEGNAYLSDFGIAVGADGGALGGPSAGGSSLGAPYASPEQLDGGEVTVTSDIYSLGVVVAQALTGLSGEVGQIRGALPPPVLRVIDRATDVDTAKRYASVATFVNEFHDALRNEALAGVATAPHPIAREVEFDNPYKGLRAFDITDAVDFHGRERLVERLITRLGQPGVRGRFIAVVGPSGSGKSSAVKAGLLPAIRRGALPLSDSWFTIEMTPAPHPFEALEDALLGVAVDPPASLLDQLAGEHGLSRALERVLPSDGSQLLLLIDQFEELFTQVDTTTANRFLDTLVSAVTDEQSRVRVIATLRADYYDRPLQHRGLGELLRDGTEAIPPMTPHELERAITGPVEQHGIAFEPGLVAELVRDVVDRAGALPLLQYTLTELFDNKRGGRITDAAYRQLGGVSGALVKRAEGLLAGLGDDAHDATRQVFLRLVTIGEGADDTRRRVLQSELEQLPIDRGMLRAVLDTFGRHRLLSFDRDPVTRSPTVEISHEALLTEWTRLHDWIVGARHDVLNQRRLAEAMGEWLAADRVETYLLRGGRLEQVHGWATTTSLPLSGPEQAFLDASIAERDREVEEDRERELRAVAAERRERQRVRQLVGVALVAVLVAALGVFGAVQWRSAATAKEDVDDLLRVADLVTASEKALIADPELALLLAVQSVRETVALGFATEEAVDAVHFALHELGVQYDVGPETPVAVRSGPSGLVGVYALPPRELVQLAEAAVVRRLTDAECVSFFDGSCPARVEIPESLPLRGGPDSYGARDPGGRALAGTSVSMAASTLRDDDGFARQLEAFTELTGIEIDLGSSEEQDILNIATGDVDRPDLVGFGSGIPTWAQARTIDIGQFLDGATLRSDFGEYLLSVGTVPGGDETEPGTGTIRAIPLTVDLKGLVYYPKAEFEAAGYEVPASWDELVALSHQILADGGTPWCFGFASGFASGWPGSDLLESLVLRVGGADTYDAWTVGDVGFTNPAVMEAGRLADALVFEPGFVRGGPELISSEAYENQLYYMLNRNRATGEAEPECWLHHQANFMLRLVPPGTRIGEDVDFFVLPPVDPVRPTPSIGGGLFASALVDRPEVRAFVQFMASPEWGEVWAADPDSGFISANRRFDSSTYGDGAQDPAAAVRIAMASAARTALDAGAWRYDASDLMPPQIGGWTEGVGPGAFWQGMVDWVDGIRTIDQVFSDIDAEWTALKAEGEP